MDTSALQAALDEKASAKHVPGVSVGVLHKGVEHYAFFGVTSVENPLPVDSTTLFQFGSTGKTFTATAIMILAEQGKLSLDDKVRKHVPELVLKDEDVAREVTVLQLLNHTGGWDGDFFEDTGSGADALEKYVALMGGLRQVSPLGANVSYNNAALSLAGRLIEKVTGLTYEAAIDELILKPLGLTMTFAFRDEIMTRRFAVGHNYKDGDNAFHIARPWGMPRSATPAGGFSANARDQLAWARFHLGAGTSADGTQVLSKASIDLMKQPTAHCPGNALGDAVGISWLLSDIDGVQIVKHGGTTIGQYSEFQLVPEHDFAVISMSNGSPDGSVLNKEIVEWALEAFCGLESTLPETVSLSDEELAAYTGRFESIAAFVVVAADNGRLKIDFEMKQETKEMLQAMGEDPDQEQPSIFVGIQKADPDRYVGVEGDATGMVGYFQRDDSGTVVTINLGGRDASRLSPVAS